MTRRSHSSAQLGFDDLLAEAKQVNEQAAFEKQYGHLPATIEEAVPFLLDVIGQHNTAMLVADRKEVFRLRDVAHSLALRLNKGNPGILTGPDAPGSVLARLTLAEEGVVPLWGQGGSFVIEVCGMHMRVEFDGLYGIGAAYSMWMNFDLNAIDLEKPFLSETGYRSFMGVDAAFAPGITPDRFAASVVEAYVTKYRKGQLIAIQERFRA